MACFPCGPFDRSKRTGAARPTDRAAEAGDFSEFSNEAAVRASIVIQGSDQASLDDEGGSPLHGSSQVKSG